jgi:small subunit ribosomal protein S6
MRLYELTVIFDSTSDESTIQGEIDKIESRVTESGGKMHRLDRWGVKRLAYLIKNRNQGYYVFFLFEAEPGVTSQIEKNLRLSEHVIRYLTVLSPGEIPHEKEAEEAKEAKEEKQVDQAKSAQE